MPSTLRYELESFRKLIPFDSVALIANREVLEAMPDIEPRTLERLEGMGVTAHYVAAGRTAASVLERIPQDADVVYVWPLLLDAGQMLKLTEGLNARGLPSFSYLGRQFVEDGMYATLSPDAGRARLARRVALDIQQILLGRPAEEIEVEIGWSERLIINIDTARRINVWPRFELLLEAELVGERVRDDLERLTLSDAVRRAVRQNRLLQAERLSVEAAAEDVAVARSQFRPSLEASLSGVQIDKDRARVSQGSSPERETTASLTATQLLYSDAALAGIAIERDLQRSREVSFEEDHLDVALDSALAYLNLLRADTQVGVRRTNLELTRSNLELARSRREIGTAGQAEIYRWESQIASDRRSLVDADAARRAARVRLNSLLHVPLDTEFRTVDVRADDPEYSPGSGLLDGYTETPLHFSTLTRFIVDQGLRAAPEIQSLDLAIAAQERARSAARRRPWLPTLSAQAGVDESIGRAGLGSGFVPSLTNDTDWSVALVATLPFYAGGRLRAESRQADLELAGLRARRQAVAEQIEAGIRTALIDARASFSSILLARAAADAARKNLELVQDAYARGAVMIIELIDAQNSSLAADLVAADAGYDFFSDLMRVQRASNRFDFFTSSAERAEWGRRIREFFEAQGVRPWRDE
jgi:outer membrane protein TolC